MNKIMNVWVLMALVFVAACGSGGKGGGGSQSTSSTQSYLGESELIRVLATKELWLPRDIMLEAKMALGPKMVQGLQNMDKYFSINCSQVQCLIIKKGK